MSGPDALSEFLPAYLGEAEELLVVARRNLLAVEAAARQGITNPRALGELFRALHTIKGLSAMIEVEPVVAISHLMEAVLRAADKAGGRLATPAVELMLEGVNAIEQRLSALKTKKPVPPAAGALLEQLEGLVSEGLANRQERTDGVPLALSAALLAKLSASEHGEITEGVRAGRRAVRLDFIPSPERAGQGLTINSVRERLAPLAALVKVLPVSMPRSASHPGGLAFALLMLTDAPDAALAQAAGVEPSQVLLLSAPQGRAAPLAPAGELPPLPDVEEEAPRQGVVRVESSRLEDAMDRVAALVVSRFRLTRAVAALQLEGPRARELQQILAENGRLLRDMRTSIQRIRMVSVVEVLERLPLMVRGLRRSTGKQVALQLDLGSTEVDKAVGDQLFPAIVHLVRNAVDHGLETPAERVRAGKPEEGTLRISCHEHSNAQLELVIADDGRGVDAAALASRAGVPVPATPEALLDLLCRPGLSSRDAVTTTSGRGMGMDIVQRIAVEQLGGELTLQTTPGKGTTFTLRVSLTISIVDAFIFECGEQRYAAAVSSVEELLEIDPREVVSGPAVPQEIAPGAPWTSGARGMGLIQRRGAAVPLVRLDEVLSVGRGGAGAKAILVRHRGQALAFAVDRMLSQQEIVVRPLADSLVRVRGVAGATDLGDGRPTLVLDLLALGSLLRSTAREGA